MNRLTFLFLACQTATLVAAESIEIRGGTNQTPLLEMYTSEGCSSCPPAEAWLSKLKDNPRLWQDFVPVAFHITYWDHLGWKDPFASADFLDRQRNYVKEGNLSAVYTPGFVIGGQEWRGWFKRHELPQTPVRPAGVLTARSEDGKRWKVTFRPTKAISSCNINLALLGFDMMSNVKAGENQGRKLTHDFVVLGTSRLAARKQNDAFEAELFADFDLAKSAKRLAAAVWVSEGNAPIPIQAIGGWLPGK